MSYYTYILFSNSINRFYTGSTDDLRDRLYRHNRGQEKYTRKGIPWNLIWQAEFADRAEAVRLEMKIKRRGAKRFLQELKIHGR